MKKISAIVVTYNRLQLLKECLRNLLNQKYPLNDIFVVNNASTDGTNKFLQSLSNSKIKVVNMKRNLGGAGGFSHGIEQAFKHSDSQYFWIMDDDTMPSKTALTKLVDASNKLSNYGFLSSNVRWWKNNKATNVPVVSPNNWSELISHSLVKIIEATFVSIIIPRNVVSKLGLPIAKEFIWCDDTEYTHRISNKYPCYFVPSSVVYHKSKAAAQDETIFNDSLNRARFFKFGYRNRLFFDRKYFPIKRFLKDFIEMFLVLLKIPFKAHSHRLLRMYYTLIGLVTGIFFNPKIQFPNK